MSRRRLKLIKDFSQDWAVYTVVTSELKLATLHDLQTKYNTKDLIDLIEIIEASQALIKDRPKEG